MDSDKVREKALKRLTQELESGRIATPLDSDVADQLAKKFGITRRAVIAQAARLSFPMRLRDVDTTAVTNSSRPINTDQHSQYGPLQGVANVTGGCATVWGWLFLGLAILMLGMLITGQF